MVKPRARKLGVALFAASIAASACSRQEQATPQAGCDLASAPVEVDGKRRLALLIGVGQYASDEIRPLKGPREDVEAMQELLSGEGGYGFPATNVCALRDADATRARVVDAIRKALIERARPGDEAVLYYSGHGAQIDDRNGDEVDGKDETFVLHDANEPRGNLPDDELNALLNELRAKQAQVTVILDSCHSGTATRGAFTPRFTELPPAVVAGGDETAPPLDGELDAERLDGKALARLIVLSAARAGTTALEPSSGGKGFFTQALVHALGAVAGKRKLRWQDVAIATAHDVAAATSGAQQPWFEGDLEQPVFSGAAPPRPLGYSVVSTQPLRLRGIVGPGMGVGAQLVVYPPDAESYADPRNARGVVEVESMDGLEFIARPLGDAKEAEVGDLALLVTPSPKATRLRLRVAERNEPGALPKTVAKRVRERLEEAGDIPVRVELVRDADAFSLEWGADESLRLRGPEGLVRNRFASGAEGIGQATEAIGRHALQAAVLALEGQGGRDFANDETLAVRIVRAPGSCAAPGFVQACANSEQIVPVCTTWEIEVTNRHASLPLLVGGAVLWNDGAIDGLPREGEQELLGPGRKMIIAGSRFRASPPLDALEHVVIAGTRKEQPVRWSALTGPAFRSAASSPLEAVLSRTVAGMRGGEAVSIDAGATWTTSRVPFRTVANGHLFERSEHALRCQETTDREYTINDFDLSPYLPEDEASPLYRVLSQGHELATRTVADGVPYKQHAWAKASDRENLALGIDCSRAVWFAFTRAGLPFTPEDRYVSTADMLTSHFMGEAFDSCTGKPLQLGDVLVYRGKDRHGNPVGHTVIVIDAERRIAWGSHGWDGNPLIDPTAKADGGVEYQLIRNKPDWKAWDSSRVALKSCWRHKQFAEAPRSRGSEGALPQGCNDACKLSGAE